MFDHITTTLRDDIHWLTIEQRVDFKVGVTTYRCMHGTAPEYLTDMFTPFIDDPGRHHLPSAAHVVTSLYHEQIYHDVRPKNFCCLRTSHLERASDLYPQHWTVAELFPPRTAEDILFPQLSYLRDKARSWRPPAIRASEHQISALNWNESAAAFNVGLRHKKSWLWKSCRRAWPLTQLCVISRILLNYALDPRYILINYTV